MQSGGRVQADLSLITSAKKIHEAQSAANSPHKLRSLSTLGHTAMVGILDSDSKSAQLGSLLEQTSRNGSKRQPN
jgi:hypothetical protein